VLIDERRRSSLIGMGAFGTDTFLSMHNKTKQDHQ